jgi:hypothetical protein
VLVFRIDLESDVEAIGNQTVHDASLFKMLYRYLRPLVCASRVLPYSFATPMCATHTPKFCLNELKLKVSEGVASGDRSR